MKLERGHVTEYAFNLWSDSRARFPAYNNGPIRAIRFFHRSRPEIRGEKDEWMSDLRLEIVVGPDDDECRPAPDGEADFQSSMVSAVSKWNSQFDVVEFGGATDCSGSIVVVHLSSPQFPRLDENIVGLFDAVRDVICSWRGRYKLRVTQETYLKCGRKWITYGAYLSEHGKHSASRLGPESSVYFVVLWKCEEPRSKKLYAGTSRQGKPRMACMRCHSTKTTYVQTGPGVDTVTCHECGNVDKWKD